MNDCMPGLGAGAGLEDPTPICLGERGLSLRMTIGLPTSFSTPKTIRVKQGTTALGISIWTMDKIRTVIT